MPLSQCNATLLEFNREKDLQALRNGISDSQYCAYDPNGEKDSCDGDSGGPLQIIDSDSTTKVVGVVSFGFGACGTRTPSVYTRVAAYTNWIESIVWPNDVVIPPLINNAIYEESNQNLTRKCKWNSARWHEIVCLINQKVHWISVSQSNSIDSNKRSNWWQLK